MTIQPWETDPAAVAFEFMTAGGLNTPEQVTDFLTDDPAADAIRFTKEAAENWELHVSEDDLREAIAAFIATRPDMEAAQ